VDQQLRTILTLLGNIVGVMSVIAVVSIVDGANSTSRTRWPGRIGRFQHFNRRTPSTFSSDFEKFLKSLHNPRITLADLAYLRERVTLAQYIDANLSASAELRNRTLNIQSVASREDQKLPNDGTMGPEGRQAFHHPGDEHSKDVVVLGFDAADRLYPSVDRSAKRSGLPGCRSASSGFSRRSPRASGQSKSVGSHPDYFVSKDVRHAPFADGFDQTGRPRPGPGLRRPRRAW